jgi:lipid A 3-O-deacylase
VRLIFGSTPKAASALAAAIAATFAGVHLAVAQDQTASAGQEQTAQEKGTITLLFENDLFYHTDRDYTNGAQLAWTSPILGPEDWAVNLAEKLPFFSYTSEVRKVYALGQDIFTPSDISLRNPPLDEHPYAGYLYAAVGVLGKTPGENGAPDRLDQVELQLGVVGPAALGEETQTFIHSIFNDTKPEGWDTQLRNEPALDLLYERAWRFRYRLFGDLEIQADPHLGGALGNVYIYANAGAMARIGFNLPDDFGPPRVDPALPGSYYFEPRKEGVLGGYVFAGVDGRAMAHNIFLDGNTWQDSRHVDKNIFVGDLDYGAALTWNRFRLTYTHVFRTREFKTQRGSDQFGAVSLSVRY